MRRIFNNAISLMVVVIVLFLVIPLPTFMLDILIVMNISLSIMILMITMSISEALEFSIFPSLLLITTLFRLGLNVSSTRLILSNGGNAGIVIKSFGNLITQGNIVIGVLIFLIIVLVQFIVITKGAERVSEVAARFTLDAMPGKQMAIDADLSSGLINEEQARLRRYKIQKEADFYGILKMVNSCYFALRHRVTSVRQAITIMGLGELRQWAYLLSASNAENKIEEGAEEFLRLSFMRASFCSSLMNYAKNMPISKLDAYLMGMFSTLHYLIDAPLDEILAQIPLRQEVKDALLKHEGRCGMLFDLALSYERADWSKIDDLANGLGIPTNLLTSLYFNCMEEVDRVWKEITKPNPAQIQAEEKPQPEQA